ncbi:MAG TPA: cation:proton antiporter [Thermococcus litoralis]|uniref:Cation:proton antiporter n=1 Tax=Thermococcus litoralis TaxID=2265 RepID=A0A7C5P1H6_THELI|nr:cation:proton antiporter [Thermococcus litoralis]
MILTLMGLILLFMGAVCDLLGAMGMHRFNTFYLRLHAATVGTVGGKFYPILGVAFIAAEKGLWPVVGISVLTALLVLITTPVGSHALAYAASKARIVEMELDEFRGDENA